MSAFGTNDLLREARELRTEDGSNPEYDRALVELVGRVLGYSDYDKPIVALAIGIAPERFE
jgi:hypothetical protein